MKKVLIVGYGNRGKTLGSHLGGHLYDSLDPNSDADFRNLDEINPSNYSEIIVATSERAKSDYIEFAIKNSLNVLVEKPLLFSEETLTMWQESASSRNILIRTAYAHKHESHMIQARDFLDSGKLGTIYTVRAFYGNGTAENIRKSVWRDSQNAVLVDLLPHLIDLTRFFLGPLRVEQIHSATNNFENVGKDFAVFSGMFGKIQCNLIVSYLSWKNTFEFEIVGSKGMLRIGGLEKWQDVKLDFFERQFPPGLPRKYDLRITGNESSLLRQWKEFKNDVAHNVQTNFSGDIEISRILGEATNSNTLF